MRRLLTDFLVQISSPFSQYNMRKNSELLIKSYYMYPLTKAKFINEGAKKSKEPSKYLYIYIYRYRYIYK